MSKWFLGPPSWRDLEAVLSDRSVPVRPTVRVIHTGAGKKPEQNGEGERQARRRQAESGHEIPFAELHAHSHFSFLDGASSPEDMV